VADIVTCPNCGKRNRVPATARGVPRCANCHTTLPWLTAAGDGDFEEVAGNSTLPVLVDLWAPWCGPCRIVEPGVERAAGSLAPRTAERLGVQGIPTLLLLRDGREVARQVGAVPPPALLRWAEEAITKPAA
jgi:thioredoxin 2